MSFRDSPFEQMNRMMNEMNSRLAMMGWNGWNEQGLPALGDDSTHTTQSAIDTVGGSGSNLNLRVERDEEGYTVLADTPGFERDELDVHFHDGSLRVSGVHEDDDEGFHSRRFSQQVSLGGDVLEGDITARYHNGVLQIHVPTEEVPDVIDEGHHIEIED